MSPAAFTLSSNCTQTPLFPALLPAVTKVSEPDSSGTFLKQIAAQSCYLCHEHDCTHNALYTQRTEFHAVVPGLINPCNQRLCGPLTTTAQSSNLEEHFMLIRMMLALVEEGDCLLP